MATDNLDAGLATPECFYHENVRYILNPEITKKYSCLLNQDKKYFVCDKVE